MQALNMIVLRVSGVPQPKGSGSVVRGGAYIEDGTKISRAKKKAWAASVKSAGIAARIGQVISTSVMVQVLFSFPIPKTRAKGPRKLVAGDKHIQKPDVDKLARGCL